MTAVLSILLSIVPPAVSADPGIRIAGATPVRGLCEDAGARSSFLPPELGTVESAVCAPDAGRPQVLFIQDAHASLEVQENIAEIIRFLTSRYGIKAVFEEGYEGQVPMDDYFGRIPEPGIRRRIAYFFMDQLRLSGAEYALVNRGNPGFVLEGADRLDLYEADLRRYRRAAAVRELNERDLGALERGLLRLAHKNFPAPFKSWMRARERYQAGRLPPADYLRRSGFWAGLPPQGAEQHAGFPMTAFFMSGGRGRPENFVSGESGGSADGRRLFEEIQRLEDRVAGRFLTRARDRQTFDALRDLEKIRRLSRLEIDSGEFDFLERRLEGIRTGDIAKFLTRHEGRTSVLSRRWEEAIGPAMEFYRLAARRDAALAGRVRDYFERSGRGTAILVAGGFHKAGIAERLAREKISYAVIMPRMSAASPRHELRYGRLMALGRHPYEMPPAAAAGFARPEGVLTQVVLGKLPEARFRRLLEELARAVRQNPLATHEVLEKVWQRGLAGEGAAAGRAQRAFRSELRQGEPEARADDTAGPYTSPQETRDRSLVGGKGASLAELSAIPGIRTLENYNVNVRAFRRFLRENGLDGKIRELEDVSEEWIFLEITKTVSNLAERDAVQAELAARIQRLSEEIFALMKSARIPEAVRQEVVRDYRALSQRARIPDVRVAVRSSATAEDLPEASFAGMQDTFLNQAGEESVLDSVRGVWASFIGSYEVTPDGGRNFSNKSVFYRNQQRALHLLGQIFGRPFGDLDFKAREAMVSQNPPQEAAVREKMRSSQIFRHSKVYISVVVQRMADPEVSGVVFTVDTKTGAPLITLGANYGLGETVVGGEASLDSWKVLRHGAQIVDRRKGEKREKMVSLPGVGIVTEEVSAGDRERFSLDDGTVREIARQAVRIEEDYRRRSGKPSLFMDLEFVVEKGQPIFLQARPETVWSNRVMPAGRMAVISRAFNAAAEASARVVFAKGFGAAPGVAAGNILVCRTLAEAKEKFSRPGSEGAILVTEKTTPEWVPVAMGKAGAFVTNIGGAFNHAAVVGRELGKPVIADARTAVEDLAAYDGKRASLNAGNATIYEGELPIEVRGREYTLGEGPVFKKQTKAVKYDRVHGGMNLVTKPRHPLRRLQKDLYMRAMARIGERYHWDARAVEIEDGRFTQLRLFFTNWSMGDGNRNREILDYLDSHEALVRSQETPPAEFLELIPAAFRDFVSGIWGGKYSYYYLTYEQLDALTETMKSLTAEDLERIRDEQLGTVREFLRKTEALSGDDSSGALREVFDAYVDMVYHFHLRWTYSRVLTFLLDEKMRVLGLPSEERANLFLLMQSDEELESTRWIEAAEGLSRRLAEAGMDPEKAPGLSEDIKRYAAFYRLIDIDDISLAPPLAQAMEDLSRREAGAAVKGKPAPNVEFRFPLEILSDEGLWRILSLHEVFGRIKDNDHHLQPRGQYRMREGLLKLGGRLVQEGVLPGDEDIFDWSAGEVLAAAEVLELFEQARGISRRAELAREGEGAPETEDGRATARMSRRTEAWEVFKRAKELHKAVPSDGALKRWIARLIMASKRLSKESFLPAPSGRAVTVVGFERVYRFKAAGTDETTIWHHQLPLHPFAYITDGIGITESENPAGARQAPHYHPDDEETLSAAGEPGRIERFQDGRAVEEKPFAFGDRIHVPAGTVHRISNPSGVIGADFTLKDPRLQLLKDIGAAAGKPGDSVRILSAGLETRPWGEIHTQVYPDLAYRLLLDRQGLPAVTDEVYPLTEGKVHAAVKIVTLRPGAQTDLFAIRPLYSPAQVVRVFPWPRRVPPGWHTERDRLRIAGDFKLEDGGGRVLAETGFGGGDLLVVDTSVRAAEGAEGFRVTNRSPDLDMMMVFVEKADPGAGEAARSELRDSNTMLKKTAQVMPRAVTRDLSVRRKASILEPPDSGVIFTIEIGALNALSSAEWRELLGLKAVHRGKMHLVILGSNGTMSSPRAEEISRLGKVYTERQLSRLPARVQAVHFSSLNDTVHASRRIDGRIRERITGYFGIYEGAFATALLYVLEDGKLPYLRRKNGYFYDPENVYAGELLAQLFRAYEIVSVSA